MNNVTITIIAAVQEKDRGIGKDNDLLYSISADLKRFKELTLNHTVIMGRNTYLSLPPKFRPLPQRTNIVISRGFTTNDSVHVVRSFEEAIEKTKMFDQECFIIGGAQVYEQALPYADRLELTLIKGNKEADRFFPDWSDFIITEQTPYVIDEKTGVAYSFVHADRDIKK